MGRGRGEEDNGADLAREMDPRLYVDGDYFFDKKTDRSVQIKLPLVVQWYKLCALEIAAAIRVLGASGVAPFLAFFCTTQKHML